MTRLPLPARRLAAGTALVALPLAAAVGCGTATGAAKQSVQSSLQKASDNLGRSGSASFTLRLQDPKGTLKKAMTSGSDAVGGVASDVLLGGTVSVTYDPVSGSLADAAQAPAGTPASEQLKKVNMSLTVQADGGPVAQVRLVRGDVYLNAGLDRIVGIAKKADPASDLGAQIDEAAQSVPAQLEPLVDDVRAGKWIKIPLSLYAQRLDAGATSRPTPTPSVDSQKLGDDLVAAVKPFVTATEASSSGDTRVVDVRVQVKQALKAALAQLKTVEASVPGLAMLDTTGVDRLGDGSASGSVTVKSDHFRTMTLDLGSLASVASPRPGSPAPDLSGSALTLDVDDAAPEVGVPGDVSPVDVGPLVQELIAPGALRSLTS